MKRNHGMFVFRDCIEVGVPYKRTGHFESVESYPLREVLNAEPLDLEEEE